MRTSKGAAWALSSNRLVSRPHPRDELRHALRGHRRARPRPAPPRRVRGSQTTTSVRVTERTERIGHVRLPLLLAQAHVDRSGASGEALRPRGRHAPSVTPSKDAASTAPSRRTTPLSLAFDGGCEASHNRLPGAGGTTSGRSRGPGRAGFAHDRYRRLQEPDQVRARNEGPDGRGDPPFLRPTLPPSSRMAETLLGTRGDRVGAVGPGLRF
jgi:hypothetical protein